MSRRQALLALPALLVGPRALAENAASAAPTISIGDQGGAILDPLSLAILETRQRRGSWDARSFVKRHLRALRKGELSSLGMLVPAPLVNFVSEAKELNAVWKALFLASNDFQRGQTLRELVPLLDRHGQAVLRAERYLLPLNGQGFLQYDYIDTALLNDAGLVVAQIKEPALRFDTLEPGVDGLVLIKNLSLGAATPALRAPRELLRIPVSSPELAERLLGGQREHLQFLELAQPAAGACHAKTPRIRGIASTLTLYAERFLVVSAKGDVLLSTDIDAGRPQPPRKAGRCR